MKANTTEGRVFYQIFKTSDSKWISRVSLSDIAEALKDISAEEIPRTIYDLKMQGFIESTPDGFLIKYTNTRLY